MALLLVEDDRELVLLPRVAEPSLQEEAVELGLGEREHALELDRVLGRQHEERLREHVRLPVDRHLALGHRLEQGRLGLRHRAVDLVDEHDVREQRTAPELEVLELLVVDVHPGHVRRLEVGRALDAREGGVLDAARDRAGEHGLPGTGNVLEQHMPVAGKRGQHELDLVVLAAQHPLDVPEQAPGDLGRSSSCSLPATCPLHLRAHDTIMATARPRLGDRLIPVPETSDRPIG